MREGPQYLFNADLLRNYAVFRDVARYWEVTPHGLVRHESREWDSPLGQLFAVVPPKDN